ncbi:MAG: histidine kinase [Tidjanibacter sp.]|nr:histidine kinase [Tidjanibacter sp.]
MSMSKEIRRILVVIVAILLFRVGLVGLYRYFETNGGFEMSYALKAILWDPVSLPLTLVVLVVATYYSGKVKFLNRTTLLEVLSVTAIVLICSFTSTAIAANKVGCRLFSVQWFSLFVVALLFGILVVLMLYVWLYFRNSKRLVSRVMEKNERTQYQYAQLKRQLNPHFLFNSLSILDYLVQEQQTERASDYIKKLANIYRYLLKQEEYVTIELDKEVEFIRLYTDILRERFLDGFDIEISLSREQLGHRIVPCALQILVENAFKHNAVSATNKLHIRIGSEGSYVVVGNNLNPKTGIAPDSTKYGLKSLKAQYRVIADAEILIEKTNDRFTVKIPLL